MSIVKEISKVIEANPGAWRKDLDAVNEGWDPYEYPESGYIFAAVLKTTGITFDSDGDTYMELCDTLADMLTIR